MKLSILQQEKISKLITTGVTKGIDGDLEWKLVFEEEDCEALIAGMVAQGYLNGYYPYWEMHLKKA